MSAIIGQSTLWKQVQALDALPPFIILEGSKGSGKKLIARAIAEHFSYPLVEMECNIEGARTCIKMSQGLMHHKIYTFFDADNMSIGAKNSLLKITEEPPQKLHIIITVEDRSAMLKTIVSRAIVFKMDPYTPAQLREYYTEVSNDAIDERVFEVATNPGEVDVFMAQGFDNFIAFVDKIYDNILEVSTSNAFKIPNSIKFKDTDDGYPLPLILKTFQYRCLAEVTIASDLKILQMMIVTQIALNNLKLRGLSKKALFDIWLLDIRRLRV